MAQGTGRRRLVAGSSTRALARLALLNLIAVLAAASCSSDPPRGKGRGAIEDGQSKRLGDAGFGATTPAPEPAGDPDPFVANEVDVVSIVRTADDRRPISPLIYGINTVTTASSPPARVLSAVTFVRRGGDRANAYNWETNVSNGAAANEWTNDLYLATGLTNASAPAAVDLELITRNRAAGRGTMVPFVLNDHVAGPPGGDIPYDRLGWKRELYFKRVGLVKPTPLSTTPDLNDGFVYSDEHFHYMRSKLAEDIYAPGPSQVMVGIDNEPDLYAFNFPMLQIGRGAPLRAANGVQIGTRVTGTEFTEKFLLFAKRIKSLEPGAVIVGPGHYHFDGWTSWHASMPEYTSLGKWYMDDFLAAAKAESDKLGKRLLDTWDFHWYPQAVSDGVQVWDLDDSVRSLTETEISAIVQGPRSYWDHDYDEVSWITRDHLLGPTWILERLQDRIARAYPGTRLGVTEYFPGGCAHVASGVAVADSLGIFARMGIHLAALWPVCARMEFALGALELLRNADGRGLRFADTAVAVQHPEKAETSVYAGSDTGKRVTILVINKTNANRRVGLRAFHSEKLASVDIYRIDAAHPSPHLALQEMLTRRNAYAYAAPPMSAAMLVFSAP